MTPNELIKKGSALLKKNNIFAQNLTPQGHQQKDQS